jgi:hypothetical protein
MTKLHSRLTARCRFAEFAAGRSCVYRRFPLSLNARPGPVAGSRRASNPRHFLPARLSRHIALRQPQRLRVSWPASVTAVSPGAVSSVIAAGSARPHPRAAVARFARPGTVAATAPGSSRRSRSTWPSAPGARTGAEPQVADISGAYADPSIADISGTDAGLPTADISGANDGLLIADISGDNSTQRPLAAAVSRSCPPSDASFPATCTA